MHTPLTPTIDLYLADAESAGLAPATRVEYARVMRKLSEANPTKGPEDFTTMDLELFLMTSPSPATRKKVLAILSGYFRYLHDRGAIRVNPTRPIRRPRLPDPDPSWWTPEEIRRVLSAPIGARDHLLLEVLARTGQRVGVVRSLTWDRVRLDLKQPTVSFLGKGGKLAVMPLDNELIHDFTVFKRMTNPPAGSWVFPSRNQRHRVTGEQRVDGYVSNLQVNRIIVRACRAAGVRVASAHEFRRSCITNLLAAGVPFDVVSRDVAGHASPITTMRHYRGAAPARVQQALRSLPY